MLRRVVVGYDGGETARDAVALAEILTARAHSDLVVARVFEDDPADRPIADLEQVAALVGGRTEVLTAPVPAAALRGLAADIGATSLIVGSRGGPGRATHAGTTCRQLLRGGGPPVAIAPRRFAGRYAADVRTIAVGYDGSAGAVAALHTARPIAEAAGARLRIVAVPTQGAEAQRSLDRSLADALASLPDELYPNAVLRAGAPAEVLLDEARSEADLLVIGGPRRRLRAVSEPAVGAEILAMAPCPVVVALAEVEDVLPAAAPSALPS